MKRGRFLAALGVTLIVTLLTCTQSFSAAPPPISGVIHGTLTCDTNYQYYPNPNQPGGYALTDSPVPCTFTARNGYPLGTGSASVLLSADLDSNFLGDIWGSFTLTTANGAWWGGFEGYNTPEATAVFGKAVGHGAYKNQQMLMAIDHMMGNAGFVMEVGPITAEVMDVLGQAFMCDRYDEFVRSDNRRGFKSKDECLAYVSSGGRLAVVDKAMPDWMKLAPKVSTCLGCPPRPFVVCCIVDPFEDFSQVPLDCLLDQPAACYR